MTEIQLVLSDIHHDNHKNNTFDTKLFQNCLRIIFYPKSGFTPYSPSQSSPEPPYDYFKDSSPHKYLERFKAQSITVDVAERYGKTTDIKKIILDPQLYTYFIDAGDVKYLEEINIDKEGRFIVKEQLKKFSKLSQEIIFIGKGNHFEIWEKKLGETHKKISRAKFK